MGSSEQEPTRLLESHLALLPGILASPAPDLSFLCPHLPNPCWVSAVFWFFHHVILYS